MIGIVGRQVVQPVASRCGTSATITTTNGAVPDHAIIVVVIVVIIVVVVIIIMLFIGRCRAQQRGGYRR